MMNSNSVRSGPPRAGKPPARKFSVTQSATEQDKNGLRVMTGMWRTLGRATKRERPAQDLQGLRKTEQVYDWISAGKRYTNSDLPHAPVDISGIRRNLFEHFFDGGRDSG